MIRAINWEGRGREAGLIRGPTLYRLYPVSPGRTEASLRKASLSVRITSGQVNIRNNEDSNLHTHRRENLKSYLIRNNNLPKPDSAFPDLTFSIFICFIMILDKSPHI
jgi:hypothetical protein